MRQCLKRYKCVLMVLEAIAEAVVGGGKERWDQVRKERLMRRERETGETKYNKCTAIHTTHQSATNADNHDSSSRY